MNTLILAVSLSVMLIGAVIGAGMMWSASGVDIGVFGWSVIGGGAVLTVALGAGLMWLSFHSARAGYDDKAHEASQALANPDIATDKTEP
jgi:phosphate/sulfate permease